MNKKIIIVTFAVLMFLSFSTNIFAKKIEKDESPQKNTSKVVAKKQVTQKTNVVKKENTTKTETQTKIQVIENITIPQNNFNTSQSQSLTGEKIDWQVISSGGLRATSTNFILSGTIGQTAVGIAGSTNFQLNAGFWQTFGTQGCCIGRRGDFNESQGTPEIDISDLVALVSFMFQGGPASGCPEEADINGSGGDPAIDISDLVMLVAFMFQGGPEPAPCP